MRNYKLNIDLLPKGAWNNDLSRSLSKKNWDILRKICYIKANNKCEICGYETNELNAHEVWKFDIKSKTQTLQNIIGICTKCHGVVHMRNSQRLGFGEKAKQHFMRVNNCSELEFASHFAESQIKFEERNKILRWKIIADLARFGGPDIKIKEKYIPFIYSQYSDKDIEKSKNYSDFKPRLLDLIVNNYNGTILIVCDKTNKVEWYADNVLIRTKYNLGQKFSTKFCVENLLNTELYFILIGKYGETVSKKFKLKKLD